MIKTIFFDFGGVIIKQPNHRWAKLWKKLLGVTQHPELVALMEKPHDAQLVKDICLGKISEDQMWVMMAEKWHIKPVWIDFFRRWLFSRRQLNRQMVKFMQNLQGSHQTAILSNAGDKTRTLMEDTYHLDHYVDEIIISAEEGVIKPDLRIFEIAMIRMDATPETSLLLDDSLPNVFAAREFGMQAVQFINTHQAIQAVRDYLNERT